MTARLAGRIFIASLLPLALAVGCRGGGGNGNGVTGTLPTDAQICAMQYDVTTGDDVLRAVGGEPSREVTDEFITKLHYNYIGSKGASTTTFKFNVQTGKLTGVSRDGTGAQAFPANCPKGRTRSLDGYTNRGKPPPPMSKLP